MELILDGERCNEDINENNIAEKITNYITQMNQEGRLVKHIYLNGENAPELITEPGKILEAAGEEKVKEVKVVSMTQEALVNETVDTIVNYLGKLIDYNNELAKSIKEGIIPDKESIIQLTDSLEWISQASNGLVVTLQDATLKQKTDDHQEIFGKMLNALKKEDYSFLGDILNNELSDNLEDLKNHLTKVNAERNSD